MSTSAERYATRERVRKHRALTRGETYTPQRRTCAACGCYLSRYGDPTDTLCAACFATHASHEDYTEQIDPAGKTEDRLHGDDTCRNGHDLLEHGQLVDAGGGRMSRRCMKCRREKNAQTHRERRARIAAQKQADA